MSITSIKHKVTGRIAAGAVGVAMIATLGLGMTSTAAAAGLTQTQISSILSLLQSFGADQATINNVNAALTGQATTGTSTGGSTGGSTAGVCPFTWTRSLQVGSNGADVKALQQFLNANGYKIAASGAGSMGNETMTFGPATKAAVMKFQTANGVSAIGLVGPATRAKLNGMCGSSSTGTTGGTTTGGTAAGTVTVSAGSQPANSLAVAGASRVPFTTFSLTNNSSAPVTVNSVTVQRTGLGVDSNFSGVVLLDQNGLQVGIAHTFNSNHQANIGDSGFTLQPGQSMTYTVAGNMAGASTAQAGQVVSLQVVAVNTASAVAGSLPITGASQTINTTLTLGTVSTSTSSVVPPGNSPSNNIGDTNVRFSGVKFTAGSAEDLKLYSVRWRQVGSVSSSDISNIMTYANGTAYPTTVDATGKYYTTVFPGGILLPKGNSMDVYVQGDITGSNAASRTVEFDIDKVTDVYFQGQLYGYGIAPSGTYTPWYKGDSFTINAGTATTINKANEVPAQNVAVNVSNQPLGGFATNFLGEPVSVNQMVFNVATTTGGAAWTGGLTSVSIVDENGRIVAGPVDANVTGATQTLTFTDTVTFPTGRHVFTLKGKVPTGVANNSTVILSTTPSSQWTSPTGQVSGNNISLPSTVVTMNTMTVKGATSTITVSGTPATQNIVPGVQNFVFANINIDASQSGEDIRLSSLPVSLTLTGGGVVGDLSGCMLWDGSTALTSGSHVINSLSSGKNTFTFDNSLVVPKGTVKTLSVSCNLSSSATTNHAFAFGVDASYGYTATGVTSGVSIVPTATTNTGSVMTAASASMTIAVDSSSPSYTLAAGGTSGVTVGVFKFRPSNEDINLQALGLTLVNGTYGSKATGNGGSSNSGVSDVLRVHLFKGSTEIGQVTFQGSTQTATSTPLNVTLPRDTDTLITAKADLAGVGISSAGGIADLIKVDPLNAQGYGVSSGATVNVGATAGVGGVQLFKSYPQLAAVAYTCTNLTSCNGSNQVLKKYSITANAAGPVSIYKQTFTIATSSASVTSVKLFAYNSSDYVSSPVSGQNSSGQIGTTQCSTGCASAPTVSFKSDDNGNTAVTIPAGQTLYFTLVGTVAPGSNANWTVTATLSGDTAMTGVGTSGVLTTATTTAKVAGSTNFIWTDNATTTATTTDVDWVNGFNVPGLSVNGI